MITCSNCGYENASDSRFCANCGASLLTGGRASDSVPSATSSDRSQLPPSSPEWRMSDAGPLPPPPRRPRWLWFILGALGLCLLICVGFYVWTQTIGSEFVANFLATAEAALTATADANNPAIGTPGVEAVVSGTPSAGTPTMGGRSLFGGTPTGN